MKNNVFAQQSEESNKRQELLARMEAKGRISFDEAGQIIVNVPPMVESIAQALSVSPELVDKVLDAETQYLTQIGVYDSLAEEGNQP